MTKEVFLLKLEEGARLAKRAAFANAYLGLEEKEEAARELEEFAEECVGRFAAPADRIINLFYFAADSITF